MIDIEELKNLILDAAEKTEPADGLGPDEALFGDESRLLLDSIDALQVSMADAASALDVSPCSPIPGAPSRAGFATAGFNSPTSD